MRGVLLTSLATLLAVVASVVANSEVLILGSDSFDLAVQGDEPVLVKFYAEWCGHCKTLAPAYAEAAKIVHDRKLGKLAEVECPKNKELCTKHGIKGYPTIKLFQNGAEVKKFIGARTTDAFVKFIEEASASKEVNADVLPELDGEMFVLTSQNFETTLKSQDVALVKFYAPWCGHCKNMATAFMDAAQTLANEDSKGILAEVDCTAHQDICKKYDVKGYPTIKLFKKGVDIERYTGARASQSFVDYVKEALKADIELHKDTPKSVVEVENNAEVLVLTPQNFDSVIGSNEAVLVKFYSPDCEHCQDMADDYKQAAVTLANQNSKARLAEVNCGIEEHASLCSKYDILGYPTIKLFKKGTEPEVYGGARSAESFVSYAHNVVSEGKPALDGHVLVLGDASFENAISKGPILVKFYATWCGHCKTMAPIYKDAAEALAKINSVGKLGEVDCTIYNDLCRKYNIDAYPSMKLFKNAKATDQYLGPRTVEAFVQYMRSAVGSERVEL